MGTGMAGRRNLSIADNDGGGGGGREAVVSVRRLPRQPVTKACLHQGSLAESSNFAISSVNTRLITITIIIIIDVMDRFLHNYADSGCTRSTMLMLHSNWTRQ